MESESASESDTLEKIMQCNEEKQHLNFGGRLFQSKFVYIYT